jgi:drug/metabolite transporter (DMT)-like permease
MQLIGPQLATSIQLLVPVCSVLLGFVLRGESLSIVQLCGIALCLSGVYIIVAASRPAPKNRDEGKDGNGFRVGMIIAFCCTASFTFGMISMRIAAQEFDVWSGTVVKVVGANMFLLLLRPFLGRFLGDGNDQPIFAKERVAPVVLFSFIGSGLGLALLTAGGKYAYIGVVSTLASTPPLWLLPLSILFLGEKLSWAKMAGVAVAICGVLLVSVPFGYFWPY